MTILESGGDVAAQIRKYDSNTGQTYLYSENLDVQDYRFFQDPDLPRIDISNERISIAHKNITEIPFEFKRRFCNQFGLDVSDVKIMFKNPWSLEIFSRIVWQLQIEPNTCFRL